MSGSVTLSDVVGPGRSSSRTIKVLLLIKGLGKGGAEQLLVSQALLGSAGYEYHVAYLLPWKDALVPELRDRGIDVTCLDGARGPGWIRRLRHLVRDRDIDIIHVHSPSVAALARTAVGRRGPHLVTTEHNVWDRYHRVTFWANALTFSLNDHVFAVSDEVKSSVRYPRGLRHLTQPPIETLHHGIDLAKVTGAPSGAGVREELAIPSSAPLVGTVANFKPHKAHDHLLQVATRVARRFPDVRFVLVGGGPLLGPMRERAKEIGIDGNVVFTGFRDDALRLMGSFDVYALASSQEGLPLSLVESMALGCPVVATRVGGISAVIRDGECGFIVEAGDADAHADRIGALLEDPSMRSSFGDAARLRARAFDVRNAVTRIEDVYGELVG